MPHVSYYFRTIAIGTQSQARLTRGLLLAFEFAVADT